MARGILMLVLALAGLLVWLGKAVTGVQQGSVDEEIKRTVRKTSNWLSSLREEWDKGKNQK